MFDVRFFVLQVDSRYTTTTQLVKLVGSHTISRIFLRIGDLKRSKMVRTINVYYNNRTVQSVVELKNRPCESGGGGGSSVCPSDGVKRSGGES